MTDIFKKAYSIIDAHDFKINIVKPSDFAEARRTMTSDVSAFVGKFSYDKTPYTREIIDCLMPDHPARIIAVMKGAPIGYTAGVIENGIAWIIAECPGNIFFSVANKDLTKEVIEKRVDQAIDSCGIRHLIRPNTMRKRNQRTGDTNISKEFAGGSLVADGTNNVDKLRNRSFMYGFIDDFEAAPVSDKEAGSIVKLIEQRFAAYAFRMKLYFISTPQIKQRSNIEPVFLLGDQRYYHVPCPKCGKMIVLQWKTEVKNSPGEIAGIIFKTDEAGKLIDNSVGYRCQECGEMFSEKYKFDMLQAGKWIPTAEPSETGYYSYHISALYAPPGMYNWTHYARNFLECYPRGFNQAPDIPKLKYFVNVVLGQTWEESGKTIKINKISKNTREYEIGKIPCKVSDEDGNGKIVMLTCACDLNGKIDDARIDYEVLAHAENGSTYSIDAGSIGTFQNGKEQTDESMTYKNNESKNVWDIFHKDVLQKQYISDTGKGYMIHAFGCDTGNFTLYAYTFVEKIKMLSPPVMVCCLKGEDGKIRRVGADTPTWRKSKERNDLYILEVNQLKDIVSDKIDLDWNEGCHQPAGFMNYPQQSDGKYSVKNFFMHYEAEHKIPELSGDGTEVGYRWKKRHSTAQNHFWDCRVYNTAARDIYVDIIKQSDKNLAYMKSWADFVNLIMG